MPAMLRRGAAGRQRAGDGPDAGPAGEPGAEGGDQGRLRARRVAEVERGQHGEEDVGALSEGVGGHWISSSARISTDCGIVSPRAFAVFMLMTSSNLVGCSTGRSAGLAPLRILST
jgi:hypothetical protein